MKEEWNGVVGWEDSYQVSSLGQVRSLIRQVRSRWGGMYWVNGRILSPNICNGYATIQLCKPDYRIRQSIHRLVARAFIGSPSDARPEVNHKDGNRLNNAYTNLEWVSRSENEIHAWKTGLFNPARGVDTAVAKITERDVRAIRDWYAKGGISQRALGERYGLDQSSVSLIVSRRNWAHVA